MKAFIFITVVILLSFSSCQQNENSTAYDYGAKSDSAVYYFNKGWEYIMDYGQWTLSEAAFRKAVTFDDDFLIGKSLVGKITRNLDERLTLLDAIEKERNTLNEDNVLLLDITLATLKLMNARDQKIQLAPEFYDEFGSLGETNYRKFTTKHPNESYMKAEYIEFLHRNQGAQIALDSLNELTTESQKNLPFFISYAASLESERGNYDKALELARQLDQAIKNPRIPSPYVLFAQIYSDMDSLTIAKSYIDKAVQLDSNHIIAQRMKSNIDSRLKEKLQ